MVGIPNAFTKTKDSQPSCSYKCTLTSLLYGLFVLCLSALDLGTGPWQPLYCNGHIDVVMFVIDHQLNRYTTTQPASGGTRRYCTIQAGRNSESLPAPPPLLF